jgi:hypothetical protein
MGAAVKRLALAAHVHATDARGERRTRRCIERNRPIRAPLQSFWLISRSALGVVFVDPEKFAQMLDASIAVAGGDGDDESAVEGGR